LPSLIRQIIVSISTHARVGPATSVTPGPRRVDIVTADTYAHVLPELARETAEATARIVPRTRRATQEPELSPVLQPAADAAGPLPKNQQLDTTEEPTPHTKTKRPRGLKVCSSTY
jgi:hypothetical protein